jgi:dihydroxyacetone kinase-like protein
MPKTSLSPEQVCEMLLQAADAVIAAEPELSEADRNLGDGDHGLGMQRGMTAAKEKLAIAPESVEKAFATLGMAMMSSMGGASGAIFGTFFRNGGKALAGQAVLDSAGLAAFLKAGVEGVQTRGGAKVGDKTVVDAMAPAAVLEASLAGLEASKAMVAQFGRAKTLGEACIGFPDAGAMSVTVILRAFNDYIQA